MAHPCKHVLVVEDDRDLRASIADLLELEGVRATLAASADEALRLLEGGRLPDVVLLDMSMPGMSGSELLRHLKQEPSWRRIPVAVMSGFGRSRFEYASMADDYLDKPFSLDRLNEALAALCRKSRAGSE